MVLTGEPHLRLLERAITASQLQFIDGTTWVCVSALSVSCAAPTARRPLPASWTAASAAGTAPAASWCSDSVRRSTRAAWARPFNGTGEVPTFERNDKQPKLNAMVRLVDLVESE
ncbi:unnamed protein product [Phytophthora lilii]|uniref:Unnamed protein product n=1 Tax=Phytophthora lilii TaxID=2077276 RepID=A0A9W6WH05_9STRA|nr:unnamed protein product [Phytophthora lilii]